MYSKPIEDSQQQNSNNLKCEPIDTINKKFSKNSSFRKGNAQTHENKFQNRKTKTDQRASHQDAQKCFSCGRDYPHKGECPAKTQKCVACKKIGHFAISRYCKKKINQVDNKQEDAANEYIIPKVDEESVENNETHLFDNRENLKECSNVYCHTRNTTTNRPFIKVKINNIDIDLLVDSGA